MDNILSKLREPLNIDEVDFRIQSISAKGYACIISYKDARVDMNRLDEVCGVNWQDDYKILNDELYCGIAIKIEGEWIWRWDVGTESTTEKVKGRASDAFKRAAYRWGIGRELYNHPQIWVQLNPDEFQPEGNKAKQTWNLKLNEWKWHVQYDEKGNVLLLTAHDQKGTLRYSFPDKRQQQQTPPAQNPQPKQQQQSAPAPAAGGELPWLNKMNTDGKTMAKNWHSIIIRITNKTLTDINLVKQHYRLSKDNETELINLIKSVNNGSN